MQISGSSLRYATGVALRTPVDLQQLFRACGAVPLGNNASTVQFGQVMQLSAKRRVGGGLTDDFSGSLAAGAPSHTTFTESARPRPYHRARNVLSMAHAPCPMPSQASMAQMIHPIFAFA
jgi:hypothetical protein